MLGEGKTARWLRLPLEVFVPWAELNGVVFARTVPGTVAGRGGALLAKAGTNLDGSNVLLTVPSDLILSVERVKEHSKVDRDFREVLESLGDFGQVGSATSLCVFTMRLWNFLAILQSSSCNIPSPSAQADHLSDPTRRYPYFPTRASIHILP